MNRSLATVLALAALLGASLLAPASAQVDVDVALDNVGGSRTLYVEDLLGNDITALDFGSGRALPFRVRVVDETMDRTGFSVSASMTKLYLDTGGSLDHSTGIPSASLSLAGAPDPLNVFDPKAVVMPVFDTVSSISNVLLCGVLGLPVVGGLCTIELGDVEGLVQEVGLPVDLSDLTALPLVPQAAEAGAFTNPSFAGAGAGDPGASGAPPATTRRLVAGAAVADGAVLAGVQAHLEALLSGLPLGELIDESHLTGLLRTAVGGLIWDTLSAGQIETILSSTTATLQSLVPAGLLAQSGTYLSFPLLQVDVPQGTPGGRFQGTLVITGLE